MYPLEIRNKPYYLAYYRVDELSATKIDEHTKQLWFGPTEIETFKSINKCRHSDRFAGRMAAKLALSQYLIDNFSLHVPKRDLVIENMPNGKPYLSLPSHYPALSTSISISHCSTGAVAAVAHPGQFVGVDFEMMLSCPDEVFSFISSDQEYSAVASYSRQEKTRLWAAKEAALKLLGLGLDADARQVQISNGDVYYFGSLNSRWDDIGSPPVYVDYHSLGNAIIAIAYTQKRINQWINK